MERQAKYEGSCPRCGGPMPNDRHPGCYVGALSRWDDKTYVCSDCGQAEAMLQSQRAGAKSILNPWTGYHIWATPPMKGVR